MFHKIKNKFLNGVKNTKLHFKTGFSQNLQDSEVVNFFKGSFGRKVEGIELDISNESPVKIPPKKEDNILSPDGFRMFRFGENKEIKLTINKDFLLNLRERGVSFRELSEVFVNNFTEIQKNPRGSTNIDSRLKYGLDYLRNDVSINRLCSELEKMCGQSLVIKQGANDSMPVADAFRFTAKTYLKAQEVLSEKEKERFKIIQPIALIENGEQVLYIMPELKGEIVGDLGYFPKKFLECFNITENTLKLFNQQQQAEGIYHIGKANLISQFLKKCLLERGLDLGSDCRDMNMMIIENNKVVLFDLIKFDFD